ncbi:MAG: M15 family metallopeptidase [Acidimicrobiales bacterium]
MEIPSNVQARINEIVSRFEPAVAPASTTSTTDFASVLSDALASASASDDATVGGTKQADLASLIAGATASRTAVLGGNNSVSAYSSASSSAPTTAIASKGEVKAVEGLYTNGRLPDSALSPIGGGHRLSPTAANAFLQMKAAAASQGVTIGVTDSYRSYDAQVDVARRKGLYSQGGLAAKPGTSDHGLGLALDLDLDAPALAWMRANGARYGFVADTPRESWHWKFDGV